MQLTKIKADILGGITAGVVALPLALAFGVQSGLGAAAGIYGAIALGFFAAILGGTPSQISGPTGPMTVVSALVVVNAINQFGGLEQSMPFILATFFLAGLFQIMFGLMRIGQTIKYIPYPVISGFMSGIGVIIILLQLFPALGHQSPTQVVDILRTISQAILSPNIQALGLTLLTILIIYVVPLLTKMIPSSLVALLVVSALSYFMHLSVPTIGHIAAGLPTLHISTLGGLGWQNITSIIIPALTLGALGSIDSLLTSVVADNMTKTRHNSNQELVGQGIGNMASAMIGGIPGAGATMRTMVNLNAGGRGRLSGVTHSLFLLAILLGLGSLAAEIPLAVLAGILITVGIGIIDYRSLKHVRYIPKTDAIIMLVVFLLTVFVNLIQAVAIGMVLASLFFMKKMSEVMEQNMRLLPLKDFRPDLRWQDETAIPTELTSSIYIKHLEGPLFFGFVAQLRNGLQSLSKAKYVIIRMSRVPYIDQSGLYAFEEVIMELRTKNIEVLIAGIQQQPHDMLMAIDIIPALIPHDHVFAKFSDSINWLQHQI